MDRDSYVSRSSRIVRDSGTGISVCILRYLVETGGTGIGVLPKLKPDITYPAPTRGDADSELIGPDDGCDQETSLIRLKILLQIFKNSIATFRKTELNKAEIL